MSSHVKEAGTSPVRLSERQRTVILVAITKYNTELCEERLDAVPDSRREKEIDANRMAITEIRERLIGVES